MKKQAITQITKHKRSISVTQRYYVVLETQWESTEAVWSCRRDFPLPPSPKAMRCIRCSNCWALSLWPRLSTGWWWPKNRFTLPPAKCFSHDSKRITAPMHSIATSCRIALHGCVKPWLLESCDKGEKSVVCSFLALEEIWKCDQSLPSSPDLKRS